MNVWRHIAVGEARGRTASDYYGLGFCPARASVRVERRFAMSMAIWLMIGMVGVVVLAAVVSLVMLCSEWLKRPRTGEPEIE